MNKYFFWESQKGKRNSSIWNRWRISKYSNNLNMQITMFIQTPAKLIHDQGCKQRTDHCELCLCRVLPLNVHSMAFVGARVILLYRCDEEVITKILDSTPEHHILLPAICHCNITHTDMKQSVTIYLYSMIGKKDPQKKTGKIESASSKA